MEKENHDNQIQVLINVFDDDNYWDMSLQEDKPEAYEAITSIGKKYSDISDYEEAMEIYNKYEPEIIEYYGGEKAIDFIVDEFDTIPVGIVKPPKLRNKLREKYIQGVSGGIGRYYDPVTPEEQLEWDKGRFGEDGNPEGTELPNITRSLKRALRSTVIKKNMGASAATFNTDIISQIRNGDFTSDDDTNTEGIRGMSYEDHMKLYDKRHAQKYEVATTDEIKEAIGDRTPTYRYSLTGDSELPVDILVKKVMINSGLKPISDERRKNMSQHERNRLLSYIDAVYVYDEKAMRKLLKQTKKSEREKDKARVKYEKAYDTHMESYSRAMTNLLTSRSRIARMFSGLEDD